MSDSTNDDSWLNRHFLILMATLLVLLGSAYIGAITFLAVPKENQRVVDTVLGFLLGSIFSAIIKFYFDSTKGGQQAQKVVADIAKAPVPPTPAAPPAAGTAP